MSMMSVLPSGRPAVAPEQSPISSGRDGSGAPDGCVPVGNPPVGRVPVPGPSVIGQL